MSSVIATEGGYQDFILRGGEWAVLILSGVAALVAIVVGLLLAKNVMAHDEGTPKMKEIAKAIQEGRLGLPAPPVQDDRHDPGAAGDHRLRHVDGDQEA